jgi:hypothetical protein
MITQKRCRRYGAANGEPDRRLGRRCHIAHAMVGDHAAQSNEPNVFRQTGGYPPGGHPSCSAAFE